MLYANSGIVVKPEENAEELMYQASHYELVASAEAIKAGHEINPEFQIGCMIAMCPIYPATCRPEDILQAEKAMQKRYYYTDVHVKGEYPVNILKYWERKDLKIDVTEEDLAVLKQGCVDYIGFSYYMSFCTKAEPDNPEYDYRGEKDRIKNQYVKTSEWGWQIDPIGLRYGIRTMAFPSISTGAYSYPLEEATEIAVKTVKDFYTEHQEAFDYVRFVLFDDRARKAYDDVLMKFSNILDIE